MAEFSISYGELESRPVFNITAKCGHSFREYRRPELTIERWLGAYGELERVSGLCGERLSGPVGPSRLPVESRHQGPRVGAH